MEWADIIGGEVASKLAVSASKSYIQNNFNKIEHDRESILKLMKNAVEYANMVVYEKAMQEKELEGMGTTLDVCLIYNSKVYIGHVGDSRVYRLRKEFFRKLTTDHSYVQQLVKDGSITKEEAYNHPKKNMLTKALGCTAYVEPDTLVKGFLKDDIILMSSDGLTNMLKDEEIYNIIKSNPDTAAEELVKRANSLGGYDNITVVIIL
jgi:serine/threonine protein phosphatase PrpC